MLNQLRNLGLSENEARVYLAMLELGPATMLQISTKAEINRPTAYVQIERLKKLGLASTQTKGKKQFFIAEDPHQLLSVIEEERKAAEQKKEELAKFLPELEALFRLSDSKPQVRFFEGREGLLRMQEEFLSVQSKEIFSISPIDDITDAFPNRATASYTNKRVAMRIPVKLIYTSKKGNFLKEEDPDILSTRRFLPAEMFPISVDITIFNERVAISAFRGRISGTIIHHPEIAKSFKAIFDVLWKTAETQKTQN